MRRMQIISPLLICSLAIAGLAQTKPRLTPAEYGKWETLGATNLSPDGKWLAYGVNRTSRNNELRIVSVAGGEQKIAPFGAQPVFSSDSRWVAYSIGYSESQEEKLRREKKPVHRKLGLLNLATGEQTVVDGIESFAFSANGAYLAMRRYAPEHKDAPPPEAARLGVEMDAPPGATLIVRHLQSGSDTTFGNVSEYAWQALPKSGRLLAMTISAEDKTGNGAQLFDPEKNALRSLDSSPAIYSGLAWRKESADLAVLRAKTDERREGPTQIAIAWKRLGESAEAKRIYDPTADTMFAGMRTVAFRRPSWSEDGEIVFLGISKWEEKPANEKKLSGGKDAKESAREEDEPASVDVWNSRDVVVMPKQKIDARLERQKNMLAAWHVDADRLTRLGRERDEQVTPLKYQKFGYVTNWAAYAMERTIGRPAADLYLVDLATGERAKIKEALKNDFYVRASPGGRYLIYLQDDNYWTVNTSTRAVVNITRNVQTAFIDRESDATVKQKPAFGLAGWTKNDESVILYDNFDLWQVAPDGSSARRLTDGAAEQTRYRYLRLDPDQEWIDTEKPAYLSMFGRWNKKSGVARLRFGAGVDRLIWLDKSVQRFAKAKDAETYSYSVEDFDDSPAVFVSDASLKEAKQVTKTNSFQGEYAWGRSELIEYKTERDDRLQGALLYPAGYQAGRKYPMIVYLYERLSDGLHQYSAPSERDYYNTAAFTQQGYFVLRPDIKFQPREPGLSVLACVTAAVKKVVETGMVDARKIGVVGHSWGGFDASYLATHSDLFAAAVAGAPITDLVSNYGNHHWSSGIAETDHIETGQQRMEVPLWEDLQAYIRNSAIYNAQNMKTPLLLECGDSDGTVDWRQSVELYNIARRAKKDVVMLVYGGEDHGLRKKSNQIDYHRRIQQWFAHYLKDEPAAPWITKGMSFLEREQELKQLKLQKEKDVNP
ncbi:MAG: S9 family peptidase [Chloracidobacterium sp.]|nr:S9 family peptidase [Chloracidobacterium sp.]